MHGFSKASYYLWRSKFGGMSVSDARRLQELEVSRRSDSKRGQHLSAFYQKVNDETVGEMLLESAFQAKKDPRLKTSGRLIAFEFAGFRWPLEPKTACYHFLYGRCVYPHRLGGDGSRTR